MSLELLAFLAQYGINIKAAHFPILTGNRRGKKTTELEIIMLGDSHGWGQGAPGYDVILPTYSVHMSVPYNKGFFSRLQKHITQKYDFYPHALTPDLLSGGNDRIQADLSPYEQIKLEVTKGPYASGFYAPGKDDCEAISHLGYLASEQKFNEDLLVLYPAESQNGNVLLRIDMVEHASKLFIGLVAGRCGARLEVYYQGSTGKDHTADYLYRLPDGYPKVTKVVNGVHFAVDISEAETKDSSIIIDTFRPGDDEDVVYCIDYGQKQRGKLIFAYDGADPAALSASDLQAPSNSPVIRLRGVIFDGNHVRNFSMGGHTVGQWLGDGSASFNDPSYSHMTEILRFVPFTPTLAIIQAPVVNEYLRQTPIATFNANLQALMEQMNQHHNKEGIRKTDVLMFTTPGDKGIQFEDQPPLPIRYEDYYAAAKDFCLLHGYGFVDFELYFRSSVDAGLLDYEFLFDDNIHPSPYVNEFIAKVLGEVIDLIM